MTDDRGTGPALPLPVRAMLDERSALLASAEPGPRATEALATAMDTAIAALAEDGMAGLRGPWAVAALGGYGACRLLPGSDIDLLVVTDARPDAVKDAVSRVLYPLWDAGLTVGHQVRSRRDHLRMCRDDLTVLTSSLTARVLAGDRRFGDALLVSVAEQARSRSKRVLKAFRERPRPGSPYLLEPDLKEGAGGRRDLDELVWTAAVLGGRPERDPDALVALGLLDAAEAERLRDADARIAAARWLLHLGRARPSSLLTLDDAANLTLDLDALHAALADVAHTLDAVRGRLQRAPAPRREPFAPEELFALLGRGEAALPELEEAAWLGRFEALLPGTRRLLTTRRPALSHRFTVGAHCLRAAALVADLHDADPIARAALDAASDRRALLVAALAHDFGKREPGPGHAERGADDAFHAARRCGLGEDAARDAAALVREHLLLADTASRRDLTDEEVILATAERVRDRALLGLLYVLTAADSLATGPGAWSPWHAVLVGELVARVDAALADDVAGVGITEAAEHVRAEALALLAGAPDGADVAAFVEDAAAGYLATRAPDEVVSDARLAAAVDARPGMDAAEVAVSGGPVPNTWRVTVAALDRHGLFAKLAGVFSLSGLSILSAQAVTDGRGIAVDTFTVTPATLADVDPHAWAGFERNLRATLADRLALEVRLAERRRHYPPARPGVPVKVAFETSSARATTVRVSAPDRVGLLHDIALVLAASGLDVRSATVLTQDDVAKDAFQVTGADGEAVRDEALLGRLERWLRDAAAVPASSGT